MSLKVHRFRHVKLLAVQYTYYGCVSAVGSDVVSPAALQSDFSSPVMKVGECIRKAKCSMNGKRIIDIVFEYSKPGFK